MHPKDYSEKAFQDHLLALARACLKRMDRVGGGIGMDDKRPFGFSGGYELEAIRMAVADGDHDDLDALTSEDREAWKAYGAELWTSLPAFIRDQVNITRRASEAPPDDPGEREIREGVRYRAQYEVYVTSFLSATTNDERVGMLCHVFRNALTPSHFFAQRGDTRAAAGIEACFLFLQMLEAQNASTNNR